MTAGTWCAAGPVKSQQQEGLRAGGEACWCCGGTGREYRPGWLTCEAHPEGPVQWYGGARPLVRANGAQVIW